jgi:hypothetical protein
LCKKPIKRGNFYKIYQHKYKVHLKDCTNSETNAPNQNSDT